MLSGEAAVGKHPHRVIEVMSEICEQADRQSSLPARLMIVTKGDMMSSDGGTNQMKIIRVGNNDNAG